MPVPLEIVFHNLDRSQSVEADVRASVEKLEHLAHDIASCRVTVEAPHKDRQPGNLYCVRIELRHPGGDTFATRAPSGYHAHRDIHVAVRDAFDAARRQLEDRRRVRRGDVKQHRR